MDVVDFSFRFEKKEEKSLITVCRDSHIYQKYLNNKECDWLEDIFKRKDSYKIQFCVDKNPKVCTVNITDQKCADEMQIKSIELGIQQNYHREYNKDKMCPEVSNEKSCIRHMNSSEKLEYIEKYYFDERRAELPKSICLFVNMTFQKWGLNGNIGKNVGGGNIDICGRGGFWAIGAERAWRYIESHPRFRAFDCKCSIKQAGDQKYIYLYYENGERASMVNSGAVQYSKMMDFDTYRNLDIFFRPKLCCRDSQENFVSTVKLFITVCDLYWQFALMGKILVPPGLGIMAERILQDHPTDINYTNKIDNMKHYDCLPHSSEKMFFNPAIGFYK
jgi:hypothetical protein